MPRYSEERKQAVLAKLLPPHELAPKTVAEQEGIALATIYNWRRQARAQGRLMPDADATGPEAWSAREKFAAVLETASMSEHERGEYCRRRGVYREQLERWRGDCERAADLAAGERQERAGQARAERRRIRELERELRRKESALAETAALLALRKKAQAVWGEDEDA